MASAAAPSIVRKCQLAGALSVDQSHNFAVTLWVSTLIV
jgi:hypothetical protein